MAPSNWLQQARSIDAPSLQAANHAPITVDKVVLLMVTIGDTTVPVWFGIVENLAVEVLLGTSFLDKHVKSIEPIQQVVVPIDSRPVDINVVDQVTCHALRQAHLATIASYTVSPAEVRRVAVQNVQEERTPETVASDNQEDSDSTVKETTTGWTK